MDLVIKTQADWYDVGDVKYCCNASQLSHFLVWFIVRRK